MPLDLARHAVTLPGWRWMPGMLIADDGAGVRLCWIDDQYIHGVAADGCAWMRLRRDREQLPNLLDPATEGCLLALAREHQRRPNLCVVAMSHCRTVESDAVLAWFVFNEPMSGDGDPPEFLDPDGRWGSDSRCAAWQTKVDALVAALGESDE